MKIGIERTLTNVKQYLEQNNHQVEELDSHKNDTKKALNNYDAIIVSGQDSNFLGMHDTLTNTPVINAEGKTAEEVYKELSDRMK